MYILDIIPLQKGIPRDTLSYYSARPIVLGSMVMIPLHSKVITGIVIAQNPARDLKSTVRTGNFSLKSIISTVEGKSFPKDLLQEIVAISTRTLVPVGTLIKQLYPDHFLEKIITGHNTYHHGDMRCVQAPTQLRYAQYVSIIKESFTKGTSVIIVAPTQHQVDMMYDYLYKEFPDQAFSCSGTISEKKRSMVWDYLDQADHPFILCTTPAFALYPSETIGVVIFESINSPYYINQFQQNSDMRSVLLPLARFLGYTRYLCDSFISTEQCSLLERRLAFLERETTPPTNKNLVMVIEKETLSDKNYRSPFFSSKTLDVIERKLQEKQQVFVYSARKSVATITQCRDCGYVVRCENCNHIMQLIKKNPLAVSDQVFHCTICQHEIPGMNRCPSCFGWNIIPMGITDESLANELEKIFPDVPCFRVSGDTVKTDSALKKIVNQWCGQGGLMIGTQKIIPWLPLVPVSIIASLEHCLSIPDMDTDTNFLWVAQQIKEATSESLIIQTKYPDQSIVSVLSSGNFSDWLDQENQLRKNFNFPPYGTLITITFKDIKRKDHAQAKDFLKKSLVHFEHSIVSQFFEFTQTYTMTGTITVPSNQHSNSDHQQTSQKLYQFLSSMRPHATITVRAPWVPL